MKLSPALLLATLSAVASALCLPPGPLWPPLPASSTAALTSSLASHLNPAIANLTAQNYWSSDVTSFSLSLVSAKSTLWTHHVTAPFLQRPRKSPVDADTVYRIASVSKVFTVLCALLEPTLNLDDPVTKHLPQLLTYDTGENGPDWGAITLRSLASQLSGLPRDYSTFDLLSLLPDAVAIGLPPLDPGILPNCSISSTAPECTVDEYLTGLSRKAVMAPPNTRSSYSNAGFVVLGAALPRGFAKTLNESIITPLNLTHTSITAPDPDEGVLPAFPPTGHMWNWKADTLAPTGGVYTSTSDLGLLLKALLSQQLLTPAQLAAWLTPQSFTSQPGKAGFYYGMPWELVRRPDGTELYTKAGAMDGYYSQIALIPEYGLGMTILTAGDFNAIGPLAGTVVAGAISVFETASRKYAEEVYAGVYVAEDRELDSMMRLEVLESERGLRIRGWRSNGTDFLGAVETTIKGMVMQPNVSVELVLVPSGVEGRLRIHFAIEIKRTWPTVAGEGDGNELCFTDLDPFTYGGLPLNEIVVEQEEGEGVAGRVKALRLRGLRVRLVRSGGQEKVEEEGGGKEGGGKEGGGKEGGGEL